MTGRRTLLRRAALAAATARVANAAPGAAQDPPRVQRGGFPLGIVRARQVAAQARASRIRGLPDRSCTARGAVTPAEARAAARACLRPEEMTAVVAGDAERVLDGLRRIAPVRGVDPDGRPLDAADLAPRAGARLDPAALVPFRDSAAVLLGGNEAGWVRTSRERTAGGFAFVEETRIRGAFRQRTEVALAADGTARTVARRGSAQGQETRTDLAYAAGRVTGTAVSPGPTGVTTTQVDAAVPAGGGDENLVVLALRTLPLAPGQPHTLSVFSPDGNAVRTHTLRVAGTERVTVPAGAFDVLRVEAAGGPAPVTCFVTADAPRRRVRVDALGGQPRMVLAP